MSFTIKDERDTVLGEVYGQIGTECYNQHTIGSDNRKLEYNYKTQNSCVMFRYMYMSVYMCECV